MTLKEAKKILKKEGFILSLASKVINQTGAIREFAKPEVCEAIKVANANKWAIVLSPIGWNEREKRLKKEHEKDAPISRKEEEKEENPALKESASQFNDALLDAQAKEITRLGKEIADLSKELAATKKELEEKTKLVGIIRNASKEYCDYGVAANEFIKKLAKLYVLVNNNGTINNEMLERCKNYQTYGFPANCNRETKKEIDDIARGNENKKPSLFRDDSVGAVTNQIDISPSLKVTVRLLDEDVRDLFKNMQHLW